MSDAKRVLISTGQAWRTRPFRRVDVVTGRNFADAAASVGLAPLLAPTTGPDLAGALLDAVHALILSGGGDLDPERYGEAPHPGLGEVDPERDATELALYRQARARGLPVLGICRGLQAMAVAEGGALHQHLPADDAFHQHEQVDRSGAPSHALRLAPDSALARTVGAERTRVNSYHHQGVARLAGDLRPVAWSDDGLVEAAEGTGDAFLLGVQWHPEFGFAQRAADRAPFAALAEAAGA